MRENDDRKACWQVVLIGVALFIVALIPRVLDLGFYLTVDESLWIGRRTKGFLLALLSGDLAATCQKYHPGVINMWSAAMGIAAKYMAQASITGGNERLNFQRFVEKISVKPYDADFLIAERLPIIFVSTLSIVLIYLLLRKMFNDEVALLGALLLSFDPFYMAHSRLALPDALTTNFMILSLLTCMMYLIYGRKSLYLVFSGSAAGIAFLSKISSATLVPTVALLALIADLAGFPEKRDLKSACFRSAFVLIKWAGVAMLVFFLLWPAMWVDPLGTVGRMLRDLRLDMGYVHRQPFMGRVVDDPGPFFYPVIFLFRTTPLVWLGGIVLLLLSLGGSSVLEQSLFAQKDWKVETAMLAVFICVYIFLMSLGVNKYERFILPIVPAVDILGALGLYVLARMLKARVKGKSWWYGLMLLPQVGLCLLHHPYYLSYYNPAVGGGRLASQLIEVGLGEGLDEAARYLNSKEGATTLKVASWYQEEILSSFFAGQSKPLTRLSIFWNDVDYVVFYINQVQRHFLPSPELVDCFLALEPEHIVRIKDINYAWIYKVPDPLPDSFPFAQHPQRVELGDQILFLGYDVETEDEVEDKLRLTLYWRALQEMEEDYIVYLKVINGVYHVWGQEEGRPRWGSFPTNWWKKGQVVGDKREIDLLPGTPPGLYQVVVDLYDPSRQRSLKPADRQELLLGPVEIPRREPLLIEALDIEHPLEIHLGGKARLLGYNIESSFRPGDGIHLTLFWQAMAKMDEDYTVFTHLVDSQARIWGQKDNEPVDGFYPTSEWEEGEIVRDQYDLIISPEAPPGNYQLEVGMYQRATGERLAVSDAAGSPARDKVFLSPSVVIK